jgi:NADH-quinone oxidoreductase subunit N
MSSTFFLTLTLTLVSQPLPSLWNFKSFYTNLYDSSFSFETYAIADMVYTASDASTLANDILSLFILIGEDLPSFTACCAVTFILSKMYSNRSVNNLVSQILLIIKRAIFVNMMYAALYYVIRLVLLHLVSNYCQTKYWITPAAYNFFVNDQQVFFSITFSFFIILVFVALHSFLETNTNLNEILPEIPVLTFLVACFSFILFEVTDFGLFIVCLEGFSLTLYVLASSSRTYGGVSASIKYFVFGTLGSIFLYWGGLGIFELSSTMKLDTIKELTEVYSSNIINDANVYSNLVWSQNCILLGFLIKLGAAPLHQWIADVYSGVPLFVTAFYATFVKSVLFILFLQFATSFASVKEIEYAALLSLAIGCFGALRQVEIKRFLAYSSITHTGYLLMGDLTSSYVYLITYVAASILFFSVLLSLNLNSKEFIYLFDLRYIGHSNQLARIVLIIALASMAGLPPFAGFYGKMAVWVSLIEDIYLFNDTWSYILFITNILISLISMFYYAQVMCILFVNNENITEVVVTKNNTMSLLQLLTGVSLTFWTFLMPYIFTSLQLTS